MTLETPSLDNLASTLPPSVVGSRTNNNNNNCGRNTSCVSSSCCCTKSEERRHNRHRTSHRMFSNSSGSGGGVGRSSALLGALCWVLAIFSVCRRPLSEALATPLVPGTGGRTTRTRTTAAAATEAGPFGLQTAAAAATFFSRRQHAPSAPMTTTSLELLRGGADATMAQSRGMASRRTTGISKTGGGSRKKANAPPPSQTQCNVLKSRPDVTADAAGGGLEDDDGRSKVGSAGSTDRLSVAAANGERLGVYDLAQSTDSSDLDPEPDDDEVHDGTEIVTRALPCEYVAETNLPTDLGHFRLRAYRISDQDFISNRKNRFVGTEPCVIYAGDKPPFGIKGGVDGERVMVGKKAVPVRIHDQCFTSEVFRSQRCDCKEQLKMSLEYVNKHGGAIIYLQQEGRGIGLANKVAAYALQDVGMDTVDANTHLGFPEDCRQYGVVPSILAEMGIDSIQLITNNPRKVSRLRDLGVDIEGTIPMVVKKANPYNEKYLKTKKQRMNHQNFGSLLSQDGASVFDESVIPPVRPALNLNVSPGNNTFAAGQPSLAEKYINEGEEMAAHAIATALIDDDDDDKKGVSAADDGYCFGRESVEDAIAAVGRGQLVVVVDDMDRENEGDFIMAADLCTPDQMATIVRYSSGVVCVGMDGERMDELDLPAMVTNNEDPKGTAFSVTVDAAEKHGITTGISAVDRAKTLQLLASSKAAADDFVRPGHIFPLRAKSKGVIERDGHTEAAVDLCKLAGRAPVGVLCEIVSEENPVEMARLPELRRFCRKHGYVLTSIVDIAQYRRDTDQ
mmetsp:Transcript_19675/g.39918  ORF Transcript_19675/g.39918 Transcript_19675/m.39918 type:complete len:792 (+) Transcript_19675:224-2599(+)